MSRVYQHCSAFAVSRREVIFHLLEIVDDPGESAKLVRFFRNLVSGCDVDSGKSNGEAPLRQSCFALEAMVL